MFPASANGMGSLTCNPPPPPSSPTPTFNPPTAAGPTSTAAAGATRAPKPVSSGSNGPPPHVTVPGAGAAEKLPPSSALSPQPSAESAVLSPAHCRPPRSIPGAGPMLESSRASAKTGPVAGTEMPPAMAPGIAAGFAPVDAPAGPKKDLPERPAGSSGGAPVRSPVGSPVGSSGGAPEKLNFSPRPAGLAQRKEQQAVTVKVEHMAPEMPPVSTAREAARAPRNAVLEAPGRPAGRGFGATPSGQSLAAAIKAEPLADEGRLASPDGSKGGSASGISRPQKPQAFGHQQSDRRLPGSGKGLGLGLSLGQPTALSVTVCRSRSHAGRALGSVPAAVPDRRTSGSAAAAARTGHTTRSDPAAALVHSPRATAENSVRLARMQLNARAPLPKPVVSVPAPAPAAPAPALAVAAVAAAASAGAEAAEWEGPKRVLASGRRLSQGPGGGQRQVQTAAGTAGDGRGSMLGERDCDIVVPGRKEVEGGEGEAGEEFKGANETQFGAGGVALV